MVSVRNVPKLPCGREYIKNLMEVYIFEKENRGKLKIIPLGGLEQIGMNITAFEYEDSIIVVDCGLAFPEDDMLGIDLVIPDVTYLKDNISKVKGFVITHGHEDHIGALPYVLKEINLPIYTTKLTMGIIENKLKEHNLLRTTKRKVVRHGQSINLDSSELNLSRRTTVFRMLPHWQSIHRQELLCIPETSRWIIHRYSEMPLICSVCGDRKERCAGSDVRQHECRAERIYPVRAYGGNYV